MFVEKDIYNVCFALCLKVLIVRRFENGLLILTNVDIRTPVSLQLRRFYMRFIADLENLKTSVLIGAVC